MIVHVSDVLRTPRLPGRVVAGVELRVAQGRKACTVIVPIHVRTTQETIVPAHALVWADRRGIPEREAVRLIERAVIDAYERSR